MRTSKQVAEIIKNIVDNDYLDNQIIYIKWERILNNVSNYN
jgi:hypothetical protein